MHSSLWVIISFLILGSCVNKPVASQEISHCNVQDPLDNVDWIKSFTEEWGDNQAVEFNIYLLRYSDEISGNQNEGYGIEQCVGSCDKPVPDGNMYYYLSCAGDTLCYAGGISGALCPTYSGSAVSSELLFTNRL